MGRFLDGLFFSLLPLATPPLRLFLAVTLLAIVATAPPVLAQQDPPNLVLIVADDLGFGDLSSYGSADIETPNIDRIGDTGMRFTDFHVNAAVCSPSRASLLTGRYPQRTGVQEGIKYWEDDQRGLDLDEVTLADRLRDELGYETGIIGKWHLGRGAFDGYQWMPVRRGFDFSFVQVSGAMDYWSHSNQIPEHMLYRGLTRVFDQGYSTNLFTLEALDFIQDHVNDPFFLFISYNAPHTPLNIPNAPYEADQMWNQEDELPPGNVRTRYRTMVEEMDEGIGRVLDRLEARGLRENTLVVFISDNGARLGLGDNGDLRGGKGEFYEGGLRSPLLASMPGSIPSGATYRGFSMAVDLFPTLYALASGQPPPASWNLDGVSLLPMMSGASQEDAHAEGFWGIDQAMVSQRAVRSGPWKLRIVRWSNQSADEASIELFHLDEDPGEQNDLADDRADVLWPLLFRIAAWEQEVEIDPILGPLVKHVPGGFAEPAKAR